MDKETYSQRGLLDFAAMPMIIFLGLLLTIALLLRYIYWKKDPPNMPPGSAGWPLLGNLPYLNFHSEWLMHKWSKKYGPVCNMKMGTSNFILLGSLEAIHEAFGEKKEIFSDRLQDVVPGISGKRGVLFSHFNSSYKEQRRFCGLALREFGMGKRSIEPRILKHCLEMREKIREKANQGKAIGIDKMFYNLTAGVTTEFLFERDLVAENQNMRDILKRIRTVEKYDTLMALFLFLPALKKIPPFSFGHRLSLVFEKKVQKMIIEQYRKHKSSVDFDKPRDMTDKFLNEMWQHKDIDDNYDVEQYIYIARDMIYAGIDTTASTFTWLILYLVKQKDIQEKVRKEINRVLGKDKEVTMDHCSQMPYTRAVIEETLRIRPPVPLGIPHLANRSGTVLGYHIPKGSILLSNIFHLHHDENVWRDSDKFDPNRHLNSEGKFMKSPQVIPFSTGARKCLGFLLAEMELFLGVVSLFQMFEFDLADDKNIDMRGQNIFSIRSYPFKVVAKQL